MTNLDYALRYADIGWRVLPLYEISPMGKCSCGKPDCHSPGKHPRTRHGLVDASADHNTIRMWWEQWPHANIGVATGEGSGIIVIDIDGDDGEVSVQGYPLPSTIEAYTGGGGRHLIYAHPGGHIKSGAGILHKVDSRGAGGYIVVAPSNHASGGEYEWRYNPWDTAPAQPPEWWVDLCFEKPSARVAVSNTAGVQEGGRNNYLAKYAGKLRRNGFDHDEIAAALQAHNQRICHPPLPLEEVEQIARSISGYSIFSPDEEALIERGDRAAKILLDNLEKERQEALKNPRRPIQKPVPPKEVVPSSGLIREIYDWIISTSRYPLPYLAMAASVSFVSTLIGRKWATHTNLRPNMYIIGLADSGAGKDHARNCITDLAMACGLHGILGGSKIASGAGLVAAVEESPVKLYQLDEIGLMLQVLFDRNAGGHKKELAELLMELYTTKNFTGTDYADRKTRKQATILHPFLSVYGTSTPSEFYKAISSGSAASGFLNRMLFIADEKTEKHRDRFPADPHPFLVDAVKSFYRSVHGDIDGNLTGAHTPVIQCIKCPDDIADSWEELDDSIQAGKYDDEIKPIYTRVPASVMKLATVFSLSRGETMLRHDDYVMARDIVLWSTALIVDGMINNVADNETERKAKRLANIIRGAGTITLEQLVYKTRWVQKWERDQIIQDLIDAGVINLDVDAGHTRPKKSLVWTGE